MSKQQPHNYEVIIADIGTRNIVADTIMSEDYCIGKTTIYFMLGDTIVAQFQESIFLGFIDHGGSRVSSSASYCDMDDAELREIHNRG